MKPFDVKTASIDETKVLIFDTEQQIKQLQNNLNVLYSALKEKLQVPKEEVKKEEAPKK